MRRTLALTLFAGLTAGSAQAEDPRTVAFDLLMNGEVVGSREVTLRYIPPEEGVSEHEVRVTQTWTQIDADIAGWTFTVRNRTTSHATNFRSSFTSSVSVNGDLSEIQGRTTDNGRWKVSEIRSGKHNTRELRPSEVDLSTMDLLDPIRSQAISDLTDIHLLSAETGDVIDGVLEDLGEDDLTIGGRTVAIHRWGVDTNEGRLELAWDAEGLLLESSMVIRGQVIETRLKALPPPREYGAFELSMDTPSIEEEEL
ncbi:MAG: hypothetical protein ACI8RZ_000967 [Myxococcota bacterium]|jgi:hypothetical protein